MAAAKCMASIFKWGTVGAFRIAGKVAAGVVGLAWKARADSSESDGEDVDAKNGESTGEEDSNEELSQDDRDTRPLEDPAPKSKSVASVLGGTLRGNGTSSRTQALSSAKARRAQQP